MCIIFRRYGSFGGVKFSKVFIKYFVFRWVGFKTVELFLKVILSRFVFIMYFKEIGGSDRRIF